ncbi:MAG: ATP-binding protein [Myxococcaceae bacterium]
MKPSALSENARPASELEEARAQVRELERALHQEERLNALTLELSRAITGEDVADALLDRSKELLGCANASLLLPRNENGKLRLVTPPSTSREIMDYWAPVVDTEDNPLIRAWNTGAPVILESREAIDREFPNLAISAEAKEKLCAVAACPLEASNRRIGVLGFSFYEPRPFDERFLRFLHELALQGAVALDRAALYEAERQAVRIRDEFLSIASHELKTPLTPLLLKLDAFSRDLKEGQHDRLAVHTDSMRRQTKKLVNLVNGLMDVSRIAAGKFQLEKREVDLTELVREVVTRVEPEAASAGCTLYVDLAERVVGQWDPMRVEQVVTNLLSNALKYGAGHPIRVAVHEAGRSAQLVVDDEGIGIESKELPRLFGRFERGLHAQHFGGLGLGLYITRQIVEAHGGLIRVESAPGKGSRFEVELPRV